MMTELLLAGMRGGGEEGTLSWTWGGGVLNVAPDRRISFHPTNDNDSISMIDSE
jgi:hypothetical protein